MRHGLRDRMAGAELFGLLCPGQLLTGDGGFYLLTTMAIHNDDIGRVQRRRCIDHVLHHGLTCHCVEHLGQGAFHARSLARRQNHYC